MLEEWCPLLSIEAEPSLQWSNGQTKSVMRPEGEQSPWWRQRGSGIHGKAGGGGDAPKLQANEYTKNMVYIQCSIGAIGNMCVCVCVICGVM